MDGWTAGRTQAQIQDFLSGGGGPGPTARIQDPHMGPIHTYVCIHTYAFTDRHMNVLAHADGWTYMYMYRRQTRRQVIYNMHNHTCACMSRHYLKISHENERFGPIETNLFHFHRISNNEGHGGVSSEPHKPKLDRPLLIHVC